MTQRRVFSDIYWCLGFRERGRYHLPTDLSDISQFSQEEPFDLSKKTKGKFRLSQSDGDSVQGSLCQEEDEDSLYRMSQYSPDDYHPSNRTLDSEEVFFDAKSPNESPHQEEADDGEGGEELSKEPMKMETRENKMYRLCGEKYSHSKHPSQQMSPGKKPNINGISQESCENEWKAFTLRDFLALSCEFTWFLKRKKNAVNKYCVLLFSYHVHSVADEADKHLEYLLVNEIHNMHWYVFRCLLSIFRIIYTI